MSKSFAKADELVKEYEELEKQMADPSIHSDQGKARQLGKRYAALGPVIAGYRAWKSASDDLAAAKEMAAEDPAFASEIQEWKVRSQVLKKNLKIYFCHVIQMMIAM